MKEPADRLREQFEFSTDRAQEYCHAGFGWYERLAEINFQTTRKLMAETSAKVPSLLRGDGRTYWTTVHQIAADHWSAVLSCTAKYCSSLSKK